MQAESVAMPSARPSVSNRLLLADLSQNRFVLDRFVVGQQKCFAQDKRKHGVALEGQRHTRDRVSWSMDNADVAAARLHDDVAAAYVNAIFVGVAFDSQVTPFQAAAFPNGELGQQALQNALAILCGDREFAIGKAMPVFGIGPLSSNAPRGVGADAG